MPFQYAYMLQMGIAGQGTLTLQVSKATQVSHASLAMWSQSLVSRCFSVEQGWGIPSLAKPARTWGSTSSASFVKQPHGCMAGNVGHAVICRECSPVPAAAPDKNLAWWITHNTACADGGMGLMQRYLQSARIYACTNARSLSVTLGSPYFQVVICDLGFGRENLGLDFSPRCVFLLWGEGVFCLQPHEWRPLPLLLTLQLQRNGSDSVMSVGLKTSAISTIRWHHLWTKVNSCILAHNSQQLNLLRGLR